MANLDGLMAKGCLIIFYFPLIPVVAHLIRQQIYSILLQQTPQSSIIIIASVFKQSNKSCDRKLFKFSCCDR